MEAHLIFVDRDGQDVTGTEEVAGYRFADFFSSDIADLLREANGDEETAQQWLKSAYLGPDIDGIGVKWIVV